MLAMKARFETEAVKTVAKYFAHTAILPDGKPDRDQGQWQFLSTHVRSVGERAKGFAWRLRFMIL